MQEQKRPGDPGTVPATSWSASVAMLVAVLDGATYSAVAMLHQVSRTAVERRVKAVATQLATTLSINGLNQHGTGFVRRLRQHRLALQDALEELTALSLTRKRSARVLSEEEIAAGARRIGARSHQPLEDLALYYMLFAIGARPLEIARLEVRDYLDIEGRVRRVSVLREDAAITSRARPLHFGSQRLDDALGAYLAERVRRRAGLGVEGEFRGLRPDSRLFLSPSGRGYEITPYGEKGQRRFRCRAIQETYRKLFRYAEFQDVTALTVRCTVADRLYCRGATDKQVGLLLGIAGQSAVREQLPRRPLTLEVLTSNLV